MGQKNLYIGLMSGTSLDGIDAVLVTFNPHEKPTVLAHYALPYSEDIRQQLLTLHVAGFDELARSAALAHKITLLYAETVKNLLDITQTPAHAIVAIGCHGQTIRHQPQAGYTLQLVHLAQLAEWTMIDVIGDFRSRDMAAGGQGAPLVPAFHHAVFSCPNITRVIVNIGGIANLTVLAPGRSVIGFDSGPGNILLDAWCQRHTGKSYDDQGLWAATGQCVIPLLQAMLADPYFSLVPPKSTGREHFNLCWLEKQLTAYHNTVKPCDVQATLTELTALSIVQATLSSTTAPFEVYLCGGGALNTMLCQRLASLLPGLPLNITDRIGLPVMQVEATAFAWLAWRHVHRQTGNLPEVTGAQGKRILGAYYPA